MSRNSEQDLPNPKLNLPIAASERPQIDQEDLVLIERCLLDDEEAFRMLMNKYSRPVYNLALQYVRTVDPAEDIVQETFFKVWRNLRKFDAQKRFSPWLFELARNTALDYIKKRKIPVFSDFDTDLEEDSRTFEENIPDPEPLPPEIFEQALIQARLQSALENIKPDERTVLLLHYKEDLTFEEIASVMGKPMNTVKSWHRRALIDLRKRLL